MSPEEESKRIAAEAAEVTRRAKEWLDAAKSVHEAVPFVKQTMVASERLYSIYSKPPLTFDSGNFGAIYSNIHETNQLLGLPGFKLPASAFQIAVSGSAGVSSATNIVSIDLSKAESRGDDATRAWASSHLVPIQKLQAEDSNIAFIRKKLAALHAGSEVEFDQSLSDYHKCVAQTMPATAAGASMRNVLESLNGHILELARRYDPSAKIKKWNDVSAIIARGAPASAQVAQLLSQKSVYDDLHDRRLTPILKNDIHPSSAEWSAIYSEYVGFLYAVLGFVDFRDGT